jgi:hypothetical protein
MKEKKWKATDFLKHVSSEFRSVTCLLAYSLLRGKCPHTKPNETQHSNFSGLRLGSETMAMVPERQQSHADAESSEIPGPRSRM